MRRIIRIVVKVNINLGTVLLAVYEILKLYH